MATALDGLKEFVHGCLPGWLDGASMCRNLNATCWGGG